MTHRPNTPTDRESSFGSDEGIHRSAAPLAPTRNMLGLTLDPERVAVGLSAVVAFLTLAHVAGVFSRHVLDHDHVFGLIRLFDLDREGNIPTLFASWMCLLNGGLLATTAVLARQRGRRDWPYWMGLAVIFVFLSVDELWSIHETLTLPVRDALGVSGVFHFAWVIPYGIAVIVIGTAYLRFLVGLRRDVRWSFLTAAALYVGGAIGIEMLGGQHASRVGENNMTYGLITGAEEVFELAGLVVLTRSILAFARAELGEVRVRFLARANAASSLKSHAKDGPLHRDAA